MKKQKILAKAKKAIKKIEWSKKFSALIALGFGIYGIWCGVKYYQLCEKAIDTMGIMPDSTLAVTCVGTVIASLVSYLLYQAGLKNSRNKYGIDADGQPFNMRNDLYNDFFISPQADNNSEVEMEVNEDGISDRLDERPPRGI